LEQPKLPNAALPQALLSPAENASTSCLGIHRVMFAKWLPIYEKNQKKTLH
jgi:hypothetical protein